ncbi:HlyD family type I secretion periplasmic adaptor subunit [Sphingomonas sp.]|uniref:HlyD family type I secretion periplasmic adaptor subunit n=1 Tax=Sphingomonas sp. TaxID=28214 RepID=UPI0025D8720F|nr:HlyD family type I secretion periplasmic adaptor subunit [Sphingomonas sp.]
MSPPIAPAEFQKHFVPLANAGLPARAERLRRHRRRAGLIIILLALLGGGGGAVIPLGGAVIASGQVEVASRVKKVAHPRGGVVAQLLVREGQHVERGAPLLRLDSSSASADDTYSTLSIDQMVARRARLEAEAAGASMIHWPRPLAARRDSAAQSAIAREAQMFAIHRAEASGATAGIAARVAQYEAELTGYRAQLEAVRQQTVLIQPELDGIEQLYKKGLAPISRRNQLERSAMELQGSLGSLQATIAQTSGKITEARALLRQQRSERRAEAGKELAQLETMLNQQRIAAANAADTLGQTVLRAPHSGTVNHLSVSAVGEVITPGTPVMDIVPDRDALVVTLAVALTDIDQLTQGQPARLRFTAFNRAATPEIAGTVRYVPPDRTTSEDGKTSFYRVQVAIDAADLARHPSIKLKQGMPVEAQISTGTRSLLSYLLKPLSDQVARAFKD